MTKPKQWTGREDAKAAKKTAAKKKQPTLLTAPVEPIPDEVDVEDNLFDKPTIGTT